MTDFVPSRICSIDPVSASILALGTAAGGAAAGALPSLLSGGGSSAATPPAPSAPPPPAPPIQSPTGTKNAAPGAPGGAATPSFVGASTLPSQTGYGAKSLLGQ